MVEAIESRDYQERIHDKAIAFIDRPQKREDRTKTLMINSPTGSGKTIMGLRLAQALKKRGHKIGWVAHRRELLRQVERANDRFFEVPEFRTISLFTRNPQEHCDLDVLFIDECLPYDSSVNVLHNGCEIKTTIGDVVTKGVGSHVLSQNPTGMPEYRPILNRTPMGRKGIWEVIIETKEGIFGVPITAEGRIWTDKGYVRVSNLSCGSKVLMLTSCWQKYKYERWPTQSISTITEKEGSKRSDVRMRMWAKSVMGHVRAQISQVQIQSSPKESPGHPDYTETNANHQRDTIGRRVFRYHKKSQNQPAHRSGQTQDSPLHETNRVHKLAQGRIRFDLLSGSSYNREQRLGSQDGIFLNIIAPYSLPNGSQPLLPKERSNQTVSKSIERSGFGCVVDGRRIRKSNCHTQLQHGESEHYYKMVQGTAQYRGSSPERQTCEQTLPHVSTTECYQITPDNFSSCAQKPLVQISEASGSPTIIGRVLDVRPTGLSTETFDIGVETNRNFYADGILVHNCQHDASASAAFIHETVKPDIVVGMSATPYRTDSAKLCFQRVIQDAGIRQLIREGWLAPFKQWLIDGDWTPRRLADLYASEPEKWGKSVIYFLTIDAAIECAIRLRDHGIKANHIVGNSPRDEILENFEEGHLDVLTNVMVLTEGFDCLDSETEVLTEDGWRLYDSVNKDGNVYSLNRQTGLTELVPIESLAQREIKNDERMVTVTSQHLALRVTEGHEFHFKYRDPQKTGSREERLSDRFITRTAAQLVERQAEFQLPLAPQSMRFEGIDLSDDEIRLVAWFMTDGHFDRSSLCVSQSEKDTKYAAHIRRLLHRLDFDFRERYREPNRSGAFPSKYGMFEFAIPKGNSKAQPRNGWHRYEDYLDKNVASMLHNMTREQFKILYDEMLLGNGSWANLNSSGWIWTAHKEQADVMCMMAILRGFTSSVSSEVTSHGEIVYRFTVRDQRWMGIRPSDARAADIEFENPKPNEKVWCLSNRNGTIIVRRKGKTAIVGNCPNLQSVFVRPASKAPTVQMAGRAFRLHPEVPTVNIIQNKRSKYPFTRHATAEEKWVLKEGEWDSLEMRNLQPLIKAQQMRIARAYIEIPDYIKKRVRNIGTHTFQEEFTQDSQEE